MTNQHKHALADARKTAPFRGISCQARASAWF